MGLSSLPAPSEGVLTVLIVNTALSISIFKEMVRSILHVVGIDLPQPSDQEAPSEAPFMFPPYAEEFRCRVPSTRFGSFFGGPTEQECSVCLNRFEPESEVNRLTCGHLFHKGCLDRWLEYWNITCPMCRAPLFQEEEASSCPWF